MDNKYFVWDEKTIKDYGEFTYFTWKSKGYYNREEGFKEFLQSKQPKRDWQIESFKTGVVGKYYEKKDFGDYWEQQLPDMLSKYPIHSVRRLSDGEIFVVGDEVYDNGGRYPIQTFRIITEENRRTKVTASLNRDENIGMMAVGAWNDTPNLLLHSLRKAPKPKPLLDRCNICGSEKVGIRGKYPKDEKRQICPTCAQERLEQIQEITSEHYKQTCKSK